MFCKPCFGGPGLVSPAAVGPAVTTPPVVHPTQYCETHSFQTTVVPHIHPSHTTLVNHQLIQNQHYFPHTQSAVNTVQQTNVPGYGPSPLVAGAAAGPYGAGPFGPSPMVAGAAAGPYGAGPFGPSPMVAGAAAGPMPGMAAGPMPGMAAGPMPGMVAGAAAGPMAANLGPNANPMLGGMYKK